MKVQSTAASPPNHRAILPLLVLAVLWGVQVSAATPSQNNTNRSDALKALCRRLDIGPGAVIADVGCGDGADTMVFAAIESNKKGRRVPVRAL